MVGATGRWCTTRLWKKLQAAILNSEVTHHTSITTLPSQPRGRQNLRSTLIHRYIVTFVSSFTHLRHIMISRLASTVVLLVGLPSTSAFSYSAIHAKIARSTKLHYIPDLPETYGRAVDCANNFGMCSIDELLDLSEGII